MITIKSEIERLQAEAEEVQRRYPNAPALPDYLAAVDAHVGKLKERLRDMILFVDGIEDPRASEIGWLRLVEDLTFAEIAAIMGYTSRHVQRIWKPYRELWERVSREKVQTVSGNWQSSCGSMGMRSSGEDR